MKMDEQDPTQNLVILSSTGHAFDHTALAGPLAHRLANISAPVRVASELASELDGLDDDLCRSLDSAGLHLERVSGLLSTLSGRRECPPVAKHDLAVEGLQSLLEELSVAPDAVRDLVLAFAAEAASGAQAAGGGTGTLVSELHDGSVRIIWQDDAPALPAHVLESFGRVQPSGRGGCGLGLAALRSAVEQAGGSLHASSDSSKFTLILPE